MVDEDMILMRIERLQYSKMVAPDIPIFQRLVSDLFPGMTLEKNKDELLDCLS